MLKKIWLLFIERLSQIGKIPICNGRPERTFHIGNFCFILCYRCTFIIVGTLISLLVLTIFKIDKKLTRNFKTRLFSIIIAFILIMATTVDGVLQYYCGIESTNFLRITTGYISGVGIGIMIIILVNYLLTFIKKWENKTISNKKEEEKND